MTPLAISAALLLATPAAQPAKADYPFAVKVTGSGKPMILIPGLACSGEVWDSTVERFKDRYECHVLTLAGFAGQPPLKGDVPFTDTVVTGIVRYVRDKKLEKPAVVGHSLGAYLVFRIGAAEPDLVGPLVAVDGFPAWFDVTMPEATPVQRKAATEGFRTKFADSSREEFLAAIREMFGAWLKGEQMEKAAKWLAGSDQKTVAKAIAELATDARPGLEKVKTPVLLIGAYAADTAKYVPSREVYEKRLRAQVEKVKGAKVAVTDRAKHFVMYDDPEWLFGQMEAVLGGR
jgi:pimeloyl-ACP methyl ester carboxylesterase